MCILRGSTIKYTNVSVNFHAFFLKNNANYKDVKELYEHMSKW